MANEQRVQYEVMIKPDLTSPKKNLHLRSTYMQWHSGKKKITANSDPLNINASYLVLWAFQYLYWTSLVC